MHLAGNPAKAADLVERKIPLHLDFVHMTQSAAARWMVYDIKIEGVSLVMTYRGTFASKVRECRTRTTQP